MVKPSPCGTWRGYKRHLADAEPACGPCMEAMRAKSRDYYARNRETELAKDRIRHAKTRRQAKAAKQPQVHTCPVCLTHYDTFTSTQVYCGAGCRKAAALERGRGKVGAPIQHHQALLRWSPAGVPLIGPSRLSVVHCRKVVGTGGLAVFCPWCNRYTSARRCTHCELEVTLIGEPL